MPTPPTGLYSPKHPVLSAVRPGAPVAVPNDPVNLERALKALRDPGCIRLKATANPCGVHAPDLDLHPT
ncbi:MetQ/NlpA family ABC transporter substrate-binding protein, partial [Methylobacterium variabile]|uniref:MetQ/NlpA family ABC transporter substrate-binding protein n=1 Tax=Methylobacterium variabile TaxID=298794 RepID=UPI000A75C6E9